ncbi:MAG: cytochrome P450, partial [Myxococcales bacterium]|nr:cytochrome P450 [Myxococcales bacterium]
EYAYPLTLDALSHLMEIPPSDRSEIKSSVHRVTEALDPMFTPRMQHDWFDAMDSLVKYFGERIAVSRGLNTSSPNLLDRLSHHGRAAGMDEYEITCMTAFIMLAGFETTAGTLGNAMNALLDGPAREEFVPEITRQQALECIRFDPIGQMTPRLVLEPFEVEGHRFHKDDRIWCILGAANRDPRVFERPNELDLERTGVKPLSFGAGIHTCIGAQVATIVIQSGLSRMGRQFSRISRVSDERQWRKSIAVRELAELPLRGQRRDVPPHQTND